MKKIIIRYSEIALKKGNRKRFENKLIENIKISLRGLDFKLERIWGRFFISDFEDETLILNKLKKISGITNFSLAHVLKSRELEDIANKAKAILEEKVGYDLKTTFKFDVKRVDKKYPLNSPSVAKKLGDMVLGDFLNLEVDLRNPNLSLGIEIYDEEILLFLGKIPSIDGLPVGISGKMTLLLSGGIDSPVAGFKIINRGVRLDALYYHSFPYTSENAKQKVIDLAKILSSYQNNYMNLYVVSFTKIQKSVRADCKESYATVMDRRFMMEIASKIASINGHQALVTGESIGQVASQTIENLTVTHKSSSLPVFTPLIASDKKEIIKIARKIDSFDISIRPYDDCCVLFAPKSPSTKTHSKFILKEEENLNKKELIRDALKNVELIKIRKNSISKEFVDFNLEEGE